MDSSNHSSPQAGESLNPTVVKLGAAGAFSSIALLRWSKLT